MEFDDLNILTNKRVLLLAPNFYSLHTQIIEALEKLGTKVKYLPDICQKHNPYLGSSSFTNLKKLYYNIFNPNKKYLSSYKCIMTEKWDYFLCIDGYSFDPIIVKYLKKTNKDLKSILYLWDSLNYFDFTRHFKYFDKILTFDPEDSRQYNLIYQPLFWTEDNTSQNIDQDLDVSFVGTLHSDRYQITKEIVKECKDLNLKYEIKLIINNTKLSIVDHIRYLYYKKRKTPEAVGMIDEYLAKKGILTDEIITNKPLTDIEIKSLINRSKCILDIAKRNQKGLSNRMIEALGANKKVITTIKQSSEYSLCSHNVQYLNRSKIKLDKEFIQSTSTICRDDIMNLRVDNWIRNLLS